MMEEIYACLAVEPSLLDYVDFKRASEPIWILGKEYGMSEGTDIQDVNDDIRSKFWFTYRKQFLPIGDSSLTSDSGWGCMHRCGQMVLAQAMMLRHFGRDWRWNAGCKEELYLKILSKFDDKEDCQYSIHKIAAMGKILEKKIGQWFGPNTIVQVLKKLCEEDPDNDIKIHVAMDCMVIKSEIRKLFQKPPVSNSEAESLEQSSDASCSMNENEPKIEKELSGNVTCHPVLLTIPLRVGLSEISPSYFNGLKSVFKLKQSLGIIGGRTNHASYFIGYLGNELIYLDPHTTQLHIAEPTMQDQTYHCQNPCRMNFTQLDPSIAQCFYLENEEDFETWCKEAQKLMLEPTKDAAFEILEDKPPMLQNVDIVECDSLNVSLNERDRIYTSDDEFELLM